MAFHHQQHLYPELHITTSSSTSPSSVAALRRRMNHPSSSSLASSSCPHHRPHSGEPPPRRNVSLLPPPGFLNFRSCAQPLVSSSSCPRQHGALLPYTRRASPRCRPTIPSQTADLPRYGGPLVSTRGGVGHWPFSIAFPHVEEPDSNLVACLAPAGGCWAVVQPRRRPPRQTDEVGHAGLLRHRSWSSRPRLEELAVFHRPRFSVCTRQLKTGSRRHHGGPSRQTLS